MASTKSVRKCPRKPKRDKDEFFMSKKDIPTVKKYKDKIQRMYDIQIHLDSKVDEGQWLIIFGDPVDRKNSKYYIQAICNPVEKKIVQFPLHTSLELSDAEKLEVIEIKTNACIRPLQKIAQFEITGSELAVTLALSRLEELVGSSIENTGDNDTNTDETDVIKISSTTHCGQKRLSDKLERALSKNSDGGCSVDDYKHAKPSVQRVLLNCLQDYDADDINDDDLFNGGSTEVANSNKQYKVHIYDDSDQLEENVTHKFTELNVSDLSDSDLEQKLSNTPAVNDQKVFFQTYASQLGFESKHVEYALTMVDASTRPSDFISLVQKISSSRGSVKQPKDNKEGNTSDDKGNDNEEDVIIESIEEVIASSPDDSPKMLGKGNTNIPEGYRDVLMRDYLQEDENCTVEELKCRNAERQKILKENFEKQHRNQPADVGKKKRKKKNKNKQSQNTTFAEQATSRTYSNDEEQTCVLRIYSNDNPQQPGTVGNLDEFAAVPCRKKDKCPTGQVTPSRPATSQMADMNQGQKGVPQYANMPAMDQGKKGFSQFTPVPAVNQGYTGISSSQVPQSPQSWTNKPMQAVAPVRPPSFAGKAKVEGPVDPKNLRYIVIDGSNVAMTHGNGKIFSCLGIKICVDYFKQRGHDRITVFVPNWRNCRPGPDNNILDQDLLQKLKEEDILVFTPSRKIGTRMVAAYDDRFVVELAEAEDAIIVSNDQYRDLMEEKATWKIIIQTRLLMYSFVKDRFMPPHDPLGRVGPTLDDFLRVSTNLDRFAPYQHFQPKMDYPMTHQGRSTYLPSQGYFQKGLQNEQNYSAGYMSNPSSPYKPVLVYYDEIDGVTKPHINTTNKDQGQNAWTNKGRGQNAWTNKGQGQNAGGNNGQGQNALANKGEEQSAWANEGKEQSAWVNKGQGHSFKSGTRSEQETQELLQELSGIFPEETVRMVLMNHAAENNLEKLANYCVSATTD